MQAYESIVRNALTEPVKSIIQLDEGWTNVVLEVNAKWIFRFVRDLSNTQLAVEQAFLPLFQKDSPLQIPEIQYSGNNYIAYKKIESAKFSETIFQNLGQRERKTTAEALGNFLSCLHAVVFEHQHIKAAPFGGNDFWRELWPTVSPRLQSDTRKKAEDYFQRAIPKVTSATYQNVIAHSDFGTNNVLIDAAHSRIVGVIDFGDLSISDPAADFATFYRRFGMQFAEDMVEHYQLLLGEDFWTRVDYESKRKLFFVVFFALNYGFEQYVPGVVRAIESQFVD
ncbi:MAG: aminoglycoside phosphotransferase family protein [Candidatus Poribacteria bacterium]|nr:aminoglycoside phosphotransferase family protein [Candidatus Poribacteria bacterium]